MLKHYICISDNKYTVCWLSVKTLSWKRWRQSKKGIAKTGHTSAVTSAGINLVPQGQVSHCNPLPPHHIQQQPMYKENSWWRMVEWRTIEIGESVDILNKTQSVGLDNARGRWSQWGQPDQLYRDKEHTYFCTSEYLMSHFGHHCAKQQSNQNSQLNAYCLSSFFSSRKPIALPYTHPSLHFKLTQCIHAFCQRMSFPRAWKWIVLMEEQRLLYTQSYYFENLIESIHAGT